MNTEASRRALADPEDPRAAAEAHNERRRAGVATIGHVLPRYIGKEVLVFGLRFNYVGVVKETVETHMLLSPCTIVYNHEDSSAENKPTGARWINIEGADFGLADEEEWSRSLSSKAKA